MKKSMMMLLAVMTALAASASWEKVGVVQIADSSRLSAAVVKLAEFTGNQMLGMMAAGAVQNPFVEDFGPAREGGDVNIVLFLDMEKALKSETEDIFDTLEYAVVYPISSTKEQFVAGHAGGEWTNGLYRVAKDEEDEDCGCVWRKHLHYAFSEDATRVACSDVPEQAVIALAESKNFKPLKSNLARIFLDPKAWSLLKKKVSGDSDVEKSAKQLMESIDSMAASVGTYEGGLELSFLCSVGKKGILSEVGKVALGEKLLAGVPSDSILAVDYAKNSGFASEGFSEIWGDFKPLLLKHGIRADYLKIVKKGGKEDIVFDHQGFFKYLSSNTELFKSIDGDKFKEESGAVIAKYSKDDPFEKLNEAKSCSLSLAGYSAKYTPAKHFARTMRGFDVSTAAIAGVFSFSGFVNALFPSVEASAPEEDRQQLAAIRKVLPAEGEGATAVMMTRKDDRIRFVLRIDGDELKPLGCFAGALMGAMMK